MLCAALRCFALRCAAPLWKTAEGLIPLDTYREEGRQSAAVAMSALSHHG
jgi:hypothetical protein